MNKDKYTVGQTFNIILLAVLSLAGGVYCILHSVHSLDDHITFLKSLQFGAGIFLVFFSIVGFILLSMDEFDD